MGVPAGARGARDGIRDRGESSSTNERGGTFSGELLAIIDPANHASQNVCRKLGFTFVRQAAVDGDFRNLYSLIL